ncbi:MAG: M56 family metallopeptidase [Lysobacter sp.]
MTDLLAFLPDLSARFVPALGRALLDFVWQGLLIGLVAAVLLQWLRDARPQLRYAIACLAMLACVLVPAAGVLADLFASAPATTASVPTSLSLDPAAIAPTAFNRVWTAPLQGTLPEGWLPLVVALWAAGASVLSLRMALGLWWIRHLRAIPQGPLQAEWQARLDALARRFGLLRHVALHVVDRLDSPVSAGWLRPVVLLPSALLTRMPVELIEALLAHELAHIRRHDYLVNLLQGLAEALLFYHPVTWWLSRRIRIEREQIADRLAADITGQPRRLALALSALADAHDHHPTPLHLAQAAHGGQLMSRIQQLVQPGRRAAGGRIAFPLVGLAAACVALVAHAQVTAPASSIPVPAAIRGPVLSTPAPRAQVARVDGGQRDAFALVRHGEDGVILSGPGDDHDEISAVRTGLDHDFVWFRRDGRAYVIDDPALVARIRDSWRDVEQLSPQMESLSDEMRVHSAKLETLSDRMRELTAHTGDSPEMRAAIARMTELATQQHALGDEQGRLGTQMAQADEAHRRALETQMDALSERMETLSAQMERQGETIEAAVARLHANQAPIEALGRQMEEASRPMEVLGKQMEALGEQQEQHARRAERESRALIEEARRNGLARPAPPTSVRR